MAAAAAASIKFTVRRRPAVLVTPASPTPRELKRLSDMDGQDDLRVQMPGLNFYRSKASMAAKDPAAVIRDAVARALVPYYPFAGRLREEHEDGGGSRLAVDCTGEGVLFVEADADVRLEQFGDDNNLLLPPFPCVEELLFDVPGSSAILGTPLLLFQVTRLTCGGFVMAVRVNHTMADAMGLTQFLGAVAELARGEAPTVQPVWERHLLDGRRPPLRLELHGGDDDNEVSDDDSSSLLPLLSLDQDMALGYIFFGPREIAAIRSQLSPDLQSRASRFDVMAGWLWKFRTMALAPPDSDEVMHMVMAVNSRGRRRRRDEASDDAPIIPTGYYGNAFATPAAVSTAGELCANPVGYAVALVKEAKDKVDMEFMRAAADHAAVLRRRSGRRRRRPRIPAGMYALSDVTKARFDGVDFGWGRPVYAGPAQPVGIPAVPWLASFILPSSKNANGEDGAVVVPMFLPRRAMDRLVDEMGKLQLQLQQPHHGSSPAGTPSPRGPHSE